MDRSRRRATGRTLVGLVVVAAALYGVAGAGGRLDAHAAADALGSGARAAAVHERTATLRTVVPVRAVDRITKTGAREAFALALLALALALAFAVRRRLRLCAPQLLPAYVRFGAPRAPPALQLEP